MNQDDYKKLQEISQMLNEAYEHYFSYEGHCKSYEGTIEIDYGNFWDRKEDPSNLTIQGVHIKSYVFCTSGRAEYFDSVDDALKEVTNWYNYEMSYDPNSPENLEAQKELDNIAREFITNMTDVGRLTIININEEM